MRERARHAVDDIRRGKMNSMSNGGRQVDIVAYVVIRFIVFIVVLRYAVRVAAGDGRRGEGERRAIEKQESTTT